MKRRTFESSGGALGPVVAAGADVSIDEARRLVSAGAVYVSGRRARDVAAAVQPGLKVTVVLEEGGQPVTAAVAPPAPLAVIHEDDDVVAVDKPAGVTAQPTPGRVGDSLLDLVSRHLGRPAGLVHRLDRETSGVTVFGKHPAATSRLAAAFREGRARKLYLAVVAPGLQPEGTISLKLSKDPSRPGRWRASASANGLAASTDYRVVAEGAVCLVALAPHTGRTHQLRAHLTALGYPIVGDRLYGGPVGPRCLLHARRLTIDGLVVEAPVPADVADVIRAGCPDFRVWP